MIEAEPERLPRGRHGLSREEVEQSQRSRMLLALAAAMTEKGYANTSVADVLKRAGVSRETFYQRFGSKLDCFIAAFDMAGRMLIGRVEQAGREASGTRLERFDHSLAAYLDVLAEQPAIARVFLIEVYAAGPEAIARRADLQSRIVDGMATLLGARSARDRFACKVLGAAIATMVTEPVLAADPDALRALRKDIVDLVRRALETQGR